MTTRSDFGENTTGLEVATAFASEIKGKIVLITGTSPKGIGAETAIAIASQDPQLLILTSRTESKVQEVVDAIHKKYPGVKVNFVQVDLGSQKSVRKAANEIKNLTSRIDVLINNAGIMALPRKYLSAEGIELQLATNHIGHFLLTNLLIKEIKASSKPRVVNVSSEGHRFGQFRFEDWNFEGKKVTPELIAGQFPVPDIIEETPDDSEETGYTGHKAYAQSKTANVLLTRYLADHGIESFSLHPGIIRTEIVRHTDKFTDDVLNNSDQFSIKPLDAGASTTMVAAFDPKLTSSAGIYLKDCQITDAAPYADSSEKAEKLWKLSEEIVGEKFSIA